MALNSSRIPPAFIQRYISTFFFPSLIPARPPAQEVETVSKGGLWSARNSQEAARGSRPRSKHWQLCMCITVRILKRKGHEQSEIILKQVQSYYILAFFQPLSLFIEGPMCLYFSSDQLISLKIQYPSDELDTIAYKYEYRQLKSILKWTKSFIKENTIE